jgi:hypothetical protein
MCQLTTAAEGAEQEGTSAKQANPDKQDMSSSLENEVYWLLSWNHHHYQIITVQGKLQQNTTGGRA